MAFERIIEFTPAWDKRDPDPAKDYGVGSVSMRMVLKGKQGAVEFLLYTGWYLPGTSTGTPFPADLGYHSLEPMCSGHIPITNKCEWLDRRPCYYDGSTLNAEEPFRILVAEGGAAVWEYLEQYYGEVFGIEEKVLPSPPPLDTVDLTLQLAEGEPISPTETRRVVTWNSG